METGYKLLIFLLLFVSTALVGFKAYTFLNKKIKDSETAWGLMAYSLLLFTVLSALFFASLYLLIWVYTNLAGE